MCAIIIYRVKYLLYKILKYSLQQYLKRFKLYIPFQTESSVARRLRRETTHKPSKEDLLLVQSIQILDKFGFEKQQAKPTSFDTNETVFMAGGEPSGFCVNGMGKFSFNLFELCILII